MFIVAFLLFLDRAGALTLLGIIIFLWGDFVLTKHISNILCIFVTPTNTFFVILLKTESN